jgi:signal transduction histidine kinase
MVTNLTTAAPRAPATHCPDFIISANSPLLCDDVNNTGEEVVVSIKDTGIGIDSEILPKLFTKFATKSDIGGTGLGLFIAKSIVESHGGKIWLKIMQTAKELRFHLAYQV